MLFVGRGTGIVQQIEKSKTNKRKIRRKRQNKHVLPRCVIDIAEVTKLIEERKQTKKRTKKQKQNKTKQIKQNNKKHQTQRKQKQIIARF